MTSLRFHFTRGEQIKFLSHLDIMRVFERAIKRAKLPIIFSEGFNPRPKLIFGLPLSVGVTSESEYADVEFNGDITPEEFQEVLNAQLPLGISIIKAVYLESNKNIMKIITHAIYEIKFEAEGIQFNELKEEFNNTYNQPTIIAMKKTKKGKKEVNIRPWINKMDLSIQEGQCTLTALLLAGIENNLRPDLLMEALGEFLNREFTIISIHRKALYVEKDSKLYLPIDKPIVEGEES